MALFTRAQIERARRHPVVRTPVVGESYLLSQRGQVADAVTFLGEFDALDTGCSSENGKVRRFRATAADGSDYEWDAYQYGGRWCLGTSADPFSLRRLETDDAVARRLLGELQAKAKDRLMAARTAMDEARRAFLATQFDADRLNNYGRRKNLAADILPTPTTWADAAAQLALFPTKDTVRAFYSCLLESLPRYHSDDPPIGITRPAWHATPLECYEHFVDALDARIKQLE